VGDEVITRRRLPHWYVPGALHFVTYRLAGTIPATVLQELREERERPAKAMDSHGDFFVRYDKYLDDHRDVAWLAKPEVAAMVRGNLYHHHGEKYHLLAYCIMPNHVHLLLQPQSGLVAKDLDLDPPDERADVRSPLARIMHSLKSYTAHEANKLIGRSGPFWVKESYDHWVREHEDPGRIIDYISLNPVTAGLAKEPHEWFWGSAHDCFLRDGTSDGLISWPV